MIVAVAFSAAAIAQAPGRSAVQHKPAAAGKPSTSNVSQGNKGNVRPYHGKKGAGKAAVARPYKNDIGVKPKPHPGKGHAYGHHKGKGHHHGKGKGHSKHGCQHQTGALQANPAAINQSASRPVNVTQGTSRPVATSQGTARPGQVQTNVGSATDKQNVETIRDLKK